MCKREEHAGRRQEAQVNQDVVEGLGWRNLLEGSRPKDTKTTSKFNETRPLSRPIGLSLKQQ